MGLTDDRPPLQAWGISADLVPLPGGYRQAVLHTSRETTAYVFKTTDRSEAALAWLTQVQDAARDAGFHVPGLRPSLRGRLCESGWTCEPFVDGTPMRASELPSLAPALSRFHDLTRDISKRPGFLAARDLLDLDAGGDIDLALMPPDISQSCRVAWRALATVPVTAVHGDLNPANILRTRSGALCLVDWDEARVDAPLFDGVTPAKETPETTRARLAWEIACSWRIEPDHARTLLPTLLVA